MLDKSNLLSTLRPAERDLLEPHMRPVEMKSGDVLFDPGQTVDQCYFPLDSAIGSFFIPLENGLAVETVMIGREGAMGGIVSNGELPSFSRFVVVHGGTFLRLSVPALDRAKEQSPSLRHLFSRYADCLMAQVFQSIACNATHPIEQRAAKWLTAAMERTGNDDITMTQEQLASMMGIGRSYASRVLQRFKRDGLVRTRRGGIEVLDRKRLETRACTCNRLVREHFATVLNGVYPV